MNEKNIQTRIHEKALHFLFITFSLQVLNSASLRACLDVVLWLLALDELQKVSYCHRK